MQGAQHLPGMLSALGEGGAGAHPLCLLLPDVILLAGGGGCCAVVERGLHAAPTLVRMRVWAAGG